MALKQNMNRDTQFPLFEKTDQTTTQKALEPSRHETSTARAACYNPIVYFYLANE